MSQLMSTLTVMDSGSTNSEGTRFDACRRFDLCEASTDVLDLMARIFRFFSTDGLMACGSFHDRAARCR
jgi:hypothetical protein